jgi:tetratricopeptide (TPR) repeat protein
MVLEALQIHLKGVHAMSKISRRTFGRHLLQLGVVTLLRGVPLPIGKHISAEERMHLHQALAESITAGWNLFHTAGNAQVLAVGQAELALLQQTHAFLYPQIRSIFYAGVYNLIGRAPHFQEQYEAALGAGDPWHVAQSLICQADTYQALGRHAEAIGCIQEALRTLGQVEEEHLRSRAHLLGCWADTAMTMGEYALSEHKLAEAEVYLDQFSPKEEFDRTSWLQLAGKRSLMVGDPKQAIAYLEEALTVSPPHWLVRRAGILIPLAIGYTRMKERDLSIRTAQQALPVLVAMNAPMTNQQFAQYLAQDLHDLSPHDEQIHVLVTEAQQQLPQLAPIIG